MPSVIPLESNPIIFNDIASKLGLTPLLEFHDVLSLTDPDLIAFLPQPVYGIILLFPLTDTYETYRKKFDAMRNNSIDNVSNIKWFEQTISNGCGYYALLHILANLPRDLIINNLILNKNLLTHLDSDSTVQDTNKLVENLEKIINLDENYGKKGQTEAPSPDTKVDLHFITFIKGTDNHIYELDGRRSGPIDLGLSVEGSNIIGDPILSNKIQFYMDNADDDSKNNFAMLAIGPTSD